MERTGKVYWTSGQDLITIRSRVNHIYVKKAHVSIHMFNAHTNLEEFECIFFSTWTKYRLHHGQNSPFQIMVTMPNDFNTSKSINTISRRIYYKKLVIQ